MVTPPRRSRNPERSEVEGSDSLGTEILRCAQDDMRGWTVSVARQHAVDCHPERSEGSDSPGTEILPLRCAQGCGSCAQDDMRGWTVSVALDMK